MLPGRALDLRTHVSVAGKSSRASFYLTDVLVARATVIGLLLSLGPGGQLLPLRQVVPQGVSQRRFDAAMRFAMDDSQTTAAYVAERAAGLRVPPVRHVAVIAGFADYSRARGKLRVGDRLTTVAGAPVANVTDVARAIARAGDAPVAIVARRAGVVVRVVVPTIRKGNRRVLGVLVLTERSKIVLPVPVRFAVERISGSSAGLMFALQIFTDLTDQRVAGRVAGTGTLDDAGNVGAIEGTRGKYVAAERIGARLFFVPNENAADLARARGAAHVVPVGTFSQALKALGLHAKA